MSQNMSRNLSKICTQNSKSLLNFTPRVTKFDFRSVGDQYKKYYDDAVLLIVYFETFYYEKITQYHESLTDFLWK